VPHKVNFLPNAMVNAQVNAHVVRDASQRKPQIRWRRPVPLGLEGCPSAVTRRAMRSAQQLVCDHLVTVRILAQRPELAVSQNAVQIQALPGLACPVELITQLLQTSSIAPADPWHDGNHVQPRRLPSKQRDVLRRESRTGPPVLVLSVFTP
jgi:hypothetical protein